ncbi:MAG TPA: ATP-binding protein [Polyangiaceae bacterium]|nr:ATP-binding protein [Polyangiaceae bacterium]
MATAEQLKALLESYVEGDDDRFFAVMIQLAAHAARQGHGKLAQDLRSFVDKAKLDAGEIVGRGERNPVPVAQPRGELAALLAASYPKARLGDLVLASEIRTHLERIVLEQRQRVKLAARALRPRRKILLVGPPGTGKTYSARALAGELHLPLFAVLLDGVITKYMGETAAKLRLVFEAAARNRGVYLFDEFDALGGERGNPNDVGEARRALNSFLQFLEQDDSESILLAATNHVRLLDNALFRRFDDIIEFALPNIDLAIAVMKAKLAAIGVTRVDWRSMGQAAKGLSYAEIAKACDDAAKDAVLHDRTEVAAKMLLTALARRHDSQQK